MQYTTLGRSKLRVSVADLGAGGFSRLGLKAGKTWDEAARLVLEAVDLGIHFIDTAAAYARAGVSGSVGCWLSVEQLSSSTTTPSGPMKPPRANTTLGDLQRATPWLWLNCGCSAAAILLDLFAQHSAGTLLNKSHPRNHRQSR